jgi:SAM-dependent methyltransferase
MSKAALKQMDCLVCGGPAEVIENFNNTELIQRIEISLGSAGLKPVMPPLSVLCRCGSCGLEFADPMIEPGAKFYQWLINSGFSYPETRWEWTACRDLINSLQSRQEPSIVVLDVGCGTGSFLQILNQIPGVQAIGIEFNPDVVGICRTMGLNVILGDLNTIKAQHSAKIDIFTFWHVVEHVADPVGMLSQARDLLGIGGLLYFSVPLTPLSYEHSWPDPFNYPPHHLTRWNIASLEALALHLGMKIHIDLPLAKPLLKRILRSLSLQAMPPFGIQKRHLKAFRLASFILRHPASILVELQHQRSHPRLNGRTLPDVALVCLQRL